jgi:hypothetical protein
VLHSQQVRGPGDWLRRLSEDEVCTEYRQPWAQDGFVGGAVAGTRLAANSEGGCLLAPEADESPTGRVGQDSKSFSKWPWIRHASPQLSPPSSPLAITISPWTGRCPPFRCLSVERYPFPTAIFACTNHEARNRERNVDGSGTVSPFELSRPRGVGSSSPNCKEPSLVNTTAKKNQQVRTREIGVQQEACSRWRFEAMQTSKSHQSRSRRQRLHLSSPVWQRSQVLGCA